MSCVLKSLTSPHFTLPAPSANLHDAHYGDEHYLAYCSAVWRNGYVEYLIVHVHAHDDSMASPRRRRCRLVPTVGRKDEGIDRPYPLAKQTTSMTSTPRLTMTMMTPIDLYRGLLYGLQALTTHTLMLTAMCDFLSPVFPFRFLIACCFCRTFHAAYILSILVGLTFGEMLFGHLRPDTAVQANDACC